MAIAYVPFGAEHLRSVLALCSAEGWPTYPADPARAARAFTAPGVASVVAVDAGTVVGFATLLSDGAIQSYLALLVVRADRRGRGVGRALLDAVRRAGGGIRVDLLAEPAAAGFYEQLPHRSGPGFRIYPDADGLRG